MKRLGAVIGFLACTAHAQVISNFQAGQVLTAQQLNAAFAKAAALNGINQVTLTGIAPQAANTLIGNPTGSTAVLQALSVPSCSTTASALNWVSGSGLTCGTVAQAGANSNITSINGLTTPLGTWAGGLGANNTASTGVPVFSAGVATVTTTPALGTPSAVVLTNATGLPVAGLAGLGTGVSAGLGAAVTGSGGIVLATSPTLTTPNLGTPSAITLTNGTGLPITTGVSGLGTGVATGLANAATGSGGPVLATSPTITTPTINGVTNGSTAGAGVLGQLLTGSTTGTAITSGTTVNATSVSLTAGSWLCWGQALFVPAASTVIANMAAGITTTSATLPASPNSSYLGVTNIASDASSIQTFLTPFNISSTTTVFLVALAGSVTVSTATVNGYLDCLRIH